MHFHGVCLHMDNFTFYEVLFKILPLYTFIQLTALSIVLNMSFYRTVCLLPEGSNRTREIYFPKLHISTSIKRIKIKQILSQANISNSSKVLISHQSYQKDERKPENLLIKRSWFSARNKVYLIFPMTFHFDLTFCYLSFFRERVLTFEFCGRKLS
jgi:hypothetical protein